MKNILITSSQRCLMARIQDLAIDVNLAGKYSANLDYAGHVQKLLLYTYPAGTACNGPESTWLEAQIDRLHWKWFSAAERQRMTLDELAAMSDHLEALLAEDKKEAKS